MTVKELREILADVPDDMRVVIPKESRVGGFLFEDACTCDTCAIDIDKHETMGGLFTDDVPPQLFLVAPNGYFSGQQQDSMAN